MSEKGVYIGVEYNKDSVDGDVIKSLFVASQEMMNNFNDFPEVLDMDSVFKINDKALAGTGFMGCNSCNNGALFAFGLTDSIQEERFVSSFSCSQFHYFDYSI